MQFGWASSAEDAINSNPSDSFPSYVVAVPIALFDLDGTLIDQKSAAREWAQSFVEAWQLSAEDRDVVASALAERRPKGEVFERLIRHFRLPVSPSEVWDDYRTAMPTLVRCSDADRAALRDLRREGWALGVVSNGMADNQVGKLKSTGIADLVDGWIVSSEVGYRKPEPQIFHAVSRRLGCPLDGWMIGDSLEMDVAGGAGVGLKTAWISADAVGQAEAVPTMTAATVACAVDRILGW